MAIFKRIGIDPGHGGQDSGACGNGYREKDITLDVSLKVRDRLVAHGFEVYMTRTTDVYVGDASARGDLLGQAKVDYGISIHINSATSVTATGAEIIAPMGETYAYTENALKQTLSEIGPFRKVFSRDYSTGNTYERGISNGMFVTSYKSNSDYYGVIRGAWRKGVSADIVELFFISNPSDVRRYEGYKEQYIEAIVEGICKASQVTYVAQTSKPVESQPEASGDGTTWYRVVVGSYANPTSAANIKTLLTQAGHTGVWIQSVTVSGAPYHRVICGSYQKRETAEQVKAKLVEQKYNGVWIDVFKEA